MRCKDFVAAVFVAAWLLTASVGPSLAQAPNRTYRLGHLGNSAASETYSRDLILPELAKLGFIEGRNLVFAGRVGESDALPGLARELLAGQPDAIIAVGPSAMTAAGVATRTVPIVTFGANPIDLGLAASYARPGGNVTGVLLLNSELDVKRLSILHEAVPDRRRVAILISSSSTKSALVAETVLQKAAADLNLELLPFVVATPADYPAAFAAMRSADAQALLITAVSEFNRDAKQLTALALEAQLPTVCEWVDLAQAGCMIGYGPKRAETRRRMAHQIAAIFRGNAPGEIPLELPTLFETAINQKVAKALGLTLNDAVLLRADQVIE